MLFATGRSDCVTQVFALPAYITCCYRSSRSHRRSGFDTDFVKVGQGWWSARALKKQKHIAKELCVLRGRQHIHFTKPSIQPVKERGDALHALRQYVSRQASPITL